VTNAIAKQRPGSTAASEGSAPSPRKQKLAAYLVTGDDELWPQVGTHLAQKLAHKQIDSVDELLSMARAGEPAVILWDARGSVEQTAVLSRLQAHSPRFAIVALDIAESAPAWSAEIQRGQIVALVPVPIDSEVLASALANAYEEANARVALLGEGTIAVTDAGVPPEGDASAMARASVPGRAADSRKPWIATGILAALLIGCLSAYLYLRHEDAGVNFTPPPSAGSAAPRPAPAVSVSEEKVDALIEEAQRAMRDRHFIEPAEGSALSLYRSALVLDPASGEAQQGLKRLTEILVARVQSALDEKQFDAALEALETVRSIDPSDSRLAALDDRITKMRAELGPAEIQAAINAQNFDRAGQLIDQAARSKSIGETKLNQLREDLRQHRGESDVARLVTLIDARLQQDQLTDPQNDSAVYYLTQARKAGASVTDVQSQYRELLRRLAQAAHSAIDQHRMSDADRLAGDLRAIGAPLSTVAGLQHEIGIARAQQAHEQSDRSRLADLAKSRLAQGNVIGPENDNALYYLNQLRSADAQNAALPQLSKDIQTQILAQAREALDAAEPEQAETLLQLASGLGSSADMDALAERLRLARAAPSNAPKQVAEASLTRTRKLEIDYPPSALDKKIEGTVEIGYVVTPRGMVSEVKVLDAKPSGIFEKAATNAVSRLRYKPVLEGGKAVAVATKMLLIFRLAT
jgi:TonB family protein